MTAHQEASFEAERWSNDGLPVYEPGEVVRGSITLIPDRDARTRGVQLWIGCRIHGSGTPEAFELAPEQFVYQGDLQAGGAIVAPFGVALPLHAPPTYQGRRVKFDWEVRLRVDVPLWADKRLSFPFIVEPRRVAVESA